MACFFFKSTIAFVTTGALRRFLRPPPERATAHRDGARGGKCESRFQNPWIVTIGRDHCHGTEGSCWRPRGQYWSPTAKCSTRVEVRCLLRLPEAGCSHLCDLVAGDLRVGRLFATGCEQTRNFGRVRLNRFCVGRLFANRLRAVAQLG